MKWADYVYYCINRFVSKTPDREAADAWPIVFLSLTVCAHILVAYFAATWALGIRVGSTKLDKQLAAGAMVSLVVFFWWRYEYRRRGAAVVSDFKRHDNDQQYARVGLFLFLETLLLPFILAGLIVAWTKLQT